jgi:hypothetical protein
MQVCKYHDETPYMYNLIYANKKVINVCKKLFPKQTNHQIT